MSLLNNLPGRPLLCYVTDRRILPAGPDAHTVALLGEKIQAVASAGVDWVQIREKDLCAKELAALLRNAAAAVRRRSECAHFAPAPTELDVALAERAGGIHLGEGSLPVREAKRLIDSVIKDETFRHDFILGTSCHSLDGVKAAAEAGASCVFFGPVFATPSKAAYGEPQGLNRLRAACRGASIPVIAISGITIENAASCISVGASGIAAIRLFQDAPDVSRML